MPYSVDWVSKTISIPASDLTLVSGTRYRLYASDFLIEIRRLEVEFNEGLWAPQILDHTNPKLDFAGSNYAGFDEVINGYVLIFDPSITRVDLIGSNSNIIDSYIANGVSIVPGNSAGLQTVTVGSGVTEQDKTDIVNGVWADTNAQTLLGNVDFLKEIEGGRWEIVSNQMIFYKSDNTTEVARFNLYSNGSPSSANVTERTRA